MWSTTLALMDLPVAVLETLKKWKDEPTIVSPCLVILACAGKEMDTVTTLVKNGIYEVTMDALKTHKFNLDVCKGVLLVLHRLTDIDETPEGMKLLAKQTAVDLLIDVISEYMEDHELVIEAVNVIANLVVNNEVAPFFLNVPAFETIAQLISKYAEDDSILSVVLRILTFIKDVDADCVLRIQTHFLDVYARLLEVHKDKLETVQKVLELAEAMTEHTDACVEAFPHFIPAVITCHELYSEEKDINMLFAKVMFYVSKQSAVVGELFDSQVASMLLTRLKKQKELEEEEIRYLICALSYIMVDDECTNHSFKEITTIDTEESWSLVNTILYEHFKNGKISAACCFLESISTTEEEDIARLQAQKVPEHVYDAVINNLEVRSTVLGAFTFCYRLLMSESGHHILNHDDCVDMISQGMLAFPLDVPVQLKGVKVLREYSLHKESVEQMKQNAAIECLIKSLNVESDEVNTNAFIAMRNMCTNSQEVQVLDSTSLPSVDDEICQTQVVKHVVEAVNRCLFRKIGSLDVMTNALELIVCLSACSKPAVSRSVQELFPSMVDYWRSKQDELDMCVLFCAAFALLAVNNRFLPVMFNAGVTELVFQVLGKHQWSHEQMLVAIRLLAYLSRNDEASRYIVMNGLQRVMLELNDHIDNIQISRTGCQLLYSLCERAEHHDALLAAKVIQYYQALIAKHSKDRTILMESLKILVTFCRTPADVTMLTSEHVTESVLNVLKVSVEQLDYEIIRMCTDVLIPFTSQRSVRPAILEAGVFVTILPVLPHFVELLSSDLVAYDFLALLRVVSNTVGVDLKKAGVTSVDPKGARLFVEAGGVAMLVKLLERYPSQESVDVIVDILHRVATSEDSYPFFWASSEISKFLRVFANESVTPSQMRDLADTLKMLLQSLRKDAEVKDMQDRVKASAIFASLIEDLRRYVAEAEVVNVLLEVMSLLLGVDAKRFCEPEITDAVKDVVATHASHKAICIKLANNLNVLCDERKFRHQMWVVDVPKPLSDILLTQPAEEEVAIAVLPVINKLCKHKQVAKSVADAPTVTAIFGCIKAADTEQVFYQACMTLRLLVRNCPEALSQFVGDNSPRAIYDGLFKYMKTELVVGIACQLLHSLLSDSAVGMDVLTLDDVTPMRNLMEQSWSMSETLVRDDVLSMCLAGLSALGNKNVEDPKALKRIGAPEVTEQVVRVCSLHSLRHSQLLLAVLSFAAMTEKGQKGMLGLHAVSECMAVLAEFVHDQMVCVNALNTLRRMVSLRPACEAVVRAGVGSILAAMRLFEEEREVQLYGLETLNGLHEYKGFLHAMETEGGVAAVVGSWKRFAEDRDVVRVGAEVVSSLTESENCGDEVVENGGVQCLLEVIELFSNEREVMIPLCQLVKAVASNPGAKATMIKEDVVSTLVTVITAGEKEDAELIGAAVAALMALVSAPFTDKSLEGTDIATLLVNAFLVVLEVETSATDVACEACMESIRALCENDRQREEVLTNDIGKVFVKVFSRSASDVQLVSSALQLLEDLSFDGTARGDLCDDALVAALCVTMTRYAQSIPVQRGSVAWLRLMTVEDYTLEYVATADVVKALLASLRNCSLNQSIVNDSYEALAALSSKPEMVEVMNTEKAGPFLEQLNEKSGSVKTVTALNVLRSVLRMKEKKRKHHHHHHQDEPAEGEEKKHRKHRHHRKEGEGAKTTEADKEDAEATKEGVEESKKHHKHRHHSRRHGTKKSAEGAEGAEGEKKHHKHHRSHRSRKPGEESKRHRHHSHRVKDKAEAISDGADPEGQN